MHTACRSSHRGGGFGPDPPELPPWMLAWIWSTLNFPLGCGPGSDPPQFPPWVWAWIWSPSISPLGVGLDLIPLNFHLGCGPGPDPPQFLPWVWAWRGVSLAGGSPWQGVLPGRGLLGRGVSLAGGSPWQGVSLAGGSPWQGGLPACTEADSPCGQTDTCQNITFANYVCGW